MDTPTNELWVFQSMFSCFISFSFNQPICFWVRHVEKTYPTDHPQQIPIPEATASFLSRLTFQWITPLLSLGFVRPLQPEDLYTLQDDRAAAYIADRITASFDKRCADADAYNAKLDNGEIRPGLLRVAWWSIRGRREDREKNWREKSGRKVPSLVFAMNDSVKWWFWSAGLLKVIGDTAQVTSPLVVKVSLSIHISTFLSNYFQGHNHFYHRFIYRSPSS